MIRHIITHHAVCRTAPATPREKNVKLVVPLTRTSVMTTSLLSLLDAWNGSAK